MRLKDCNNVAQYTLYPIIFNIMATDFIMSDEQRQLLKDSEPGPKWVRVKPSPDGIERFEFVDGLTKAVLNRGNNMWPKSWSVDFLELNIHHRLKCSFDCDPEKAQKEAGKHIKDEVFKLMMFAIQL